ncbi:LSU ribosomal protein L10p (P0) [Thermogutta terrifontis]|uniref:Large ribosomal subunit protein uL10 n=1 Tax=Thermogutta terrifontis TaxID=1331910 RepID=A0A286RJH8_9BACT|nr:LSU ribosomal protein L10p (P0) [Thermogutta terrifontis]
MLVNVIGLDANRTRRLRKELAERNIHLMVVKNTLAARAFRGTPLERAFENITGPTAICWGGEDIVSLTKEVVRFAKDENFAPFSTKGGVLEGEPLTPQQVEEISKWPSRQELLAQLAARLMGPASTLMSALAGPGSTLAGQLKQLAEGEKTGAEGESGASGAGSS